MDYPPEYGWVACDTWSGCFGKPWQHQSQAEACSESPIPGPGFWPSVTSQGFPFCDSAGTVHFGLSLLPYCRNPETGQAGDIESNNPSWCYYYRCVDQQYTVKLFLVYGSAESTTVLTSVEPTDRLSSASGKNATYLIARVYDQNGQMVPDINIQITVDVKPNSGGHQHDNADRHTEYIGQLASPQGTVEQNGKVLKGNTGAYGLAFTFTAAEPAGDHFFTAKCTDGKNCTLQGPDTIWVGIKNLAPIPHATDPSGYQLYALIGQDDAHPNNHYLTSDALTRLTVLAGQYRDEFPNDPPLSLNDASLERGGVFDIAFDSHMDQDGVYHSRTAGTAPGQWWVAPHIEHRRGTVIDIRANGTSSAIPPRNYNQFKFILQMLQIRYLYEGDHFHVRLLGLSQ